jgi:outer membrane biosynthesis protein TonB
MEWLEQNIDAYRIVSEILGQLRVAIRDGLEREFGDEWYEAGVPEDVFERLVGAKEREKSIDWYEGQYQQIMDYATFPDLIQILEQNPDLFPTLVGLAPSPALLHARFLELDVMRAKLGRARPISETELSFLGTFHLRFHKAVDEAHVEAADERSTRAPEADPDEEPEELTEVSDESPADEEDDSSVGIDEPTRPRPAVAAKKKASKKKAAEKRESEKKAAKKKPAEKKTAAKKKAAKNPAKRVRSEEDDILTKEIHAGEDEIKDEDDFEDDDGFEDEAVDEDDGGDDDTNIDVERRSSPEATTTNISEALADNDHTEILRHLYREVTRIAEGIWSNEVTPAPMVWEQVTASDWYEVNFSRLGLQPLSVFYEVVAKIEDTMGGGADKNQLQELLRESNFARTLLQLRDMFQANDI